MLRTRVITAVALMPLVLGMLFFAPRWLWALFALLIGLLAAWEWSRLTRLEPVLQRAYVAFSGSVGVLLVSLYLVSPLRLYPAVAQALLWIAAAFWIAGVPLWLAKRLQPAPWVVAIAGVLVIWPFWVALVDLRDRSKWVLLAAAVIVWIADIAAYFAGRAFGKRKLAPAISPNKSWEGVYGAIAGVMAYALALLFWSTGGAFSAWWIVFIASCALLTAVSVLGDLFESWMKRGAGVKDSSNLLPGHGGILDRIDALTSTLPVAALLVSLKGTL